MRQFLFSFLFIAILCTGCRQQATQSKEGIISTDTIRYAQGLTIERYAGHTIVEVNNPWENGELLQRYILVERDKPLPGNLPSGTVVRVPIQRVAIYTSVHASILDMLGETDRIAGVCEPRYMQAIASIQEGVTTGKIVDLGESTAPNIEKMINTGVEYIIATPFQNNGYGAVEKMGLPIIEGADYMESLPLGRTEWIRFYGLLVGQEEKADSLFRTTEQRYNELKEMTASVGHRPTVISEKKYGSSWHIAGGDSYIAHLFADAGANYVFKEITGSGSLPFAFESVLDNGQHADFWLIKYNQPTDMTYQELRAEYTPYEQFDAFKNRNIYGCNTGHVPYYEEFPLHPEYLLADYVSIFHPGLIPGYKRRYYKALNMDN